MREFAKIEILSQKCSICGSRNKRFGEYIADKKRLGYMLICCNCGHVDSFINDLDPMGSILSFDRGIGKEICLRQSHCPHTDCKFHAIDKMWDNFDDIDSIYDEQQRCLCAICKEPHKEPYSEISTAFELDDKSVKFR